MLADGRRSSWLEASHQRSLVAALRSTLEHAAAARARALYFEYDLDNDWGGDFFLCERYAPESAGDDDWACDWLADSPGPAFAEASKIYLENHFDRTPMAKGSTLYLVARTVASFGRSCGAIHVQPPAVCIGFHDQSPVFRIRESVGEGLH